MDNVASEDEVEMTPDTHPAADDMKEVDAEDAKPDEQPLGGEAAIAASRSEGGHSLSSTRRGASECEQLAHRVETKRENRIPVTMAIRKKFLKTCKHIAIDKGYPSHSKIHREDLMQLREKVQEDVNKAQRVEVQGTQLSAPNWHSRVFEFMGFLNQNEVLLKMLDRAVTVVNDVQLRDDDWFYFRDFSFYHTEVVSRWPILRSPLRVAFTGIFCYYFFTPIWFCHIIDDEDVCPDDPDEGRDRSYYGWMTSLYFASATMSTVGYGDVSVEKSSSWRVFFGICWMILSMLVAISAFSAAADAASTPLDDVRERILELIPWYKRSRDARHLALHKRIRQLKFIKITEIVFQFTMLNLIGFFVSQIFASNSTIRDERWTWMESFYWAVQTTTTIGYGDLVIPFDMRWFNIFYLMLSTYFVGSAFGKLSSLKQELDATRKFYAWERREVSKRMIEDFQAYDHDDVVDQYEFVLGSLLTLCKVSSSDIVPIMDKFRELAGDKGFISVEDVDKNEEESKDKPSEGEAAAEGDVPATS